MAVISIGESQIIMKMRKWKNYYNLRNSPSISLTIRDGGKPIFKTQTNSEEKAFKNVLNFMCEKYQFNLAELLGIRRKKDEKVRED